MSSSGISASGSEMSSRFFVVTGRVQGVGFRWWCRTVARRLGVSGWVRNRPDGAVEVFAVGSEEVLQELEDFMRGGPPAAVVSAVQVREAPEDFPGHGFEIRR